MITREQLDEALRAIKTNFDAEKFMADELAKVAANPLFQRYAQMSQAIVSQLTHRRDHPTGPRISAAWQAEGERLSNVGGLCMLNLPVVFLPTLALGNDPIMLRAGLCGVLGAAQTYLWTNKIVDTMRKFPLPPHVIGREILPYPFMYNTYEVAYDVKFTSGVTEGGLPDKCLCDWTAMVDAVTGINVAMNAVDAEGVDTTTYILNHGIIKYGSRYPDDFSEQIIVPAGSVLKMLAFLASPFIAVEKQKMPRQFRRHEGKDTTAAEQIVSVVRLRRSAAQAMDQYESESREWQHRWWVSGHMRAQWYPSENSHKVIWIAPYLKGPDGKPVRDRVYSVVR